MTKKKKRHFSKAKRKQTAKSSFAKFKKIVEVELGKVDWKKVGTFTVVLLIIIASKGVLGPKAAMIAKQIISFAQAAPVA